MATTIRDLLVRLGVDADNAELHSFDANLGKVKSSAMSLGIVLGGLGFGIAKISEAGSNAEKTRVSFETMLGSAEKADKIIKDIGKLTLESPFQFENAESTVKMMIAMGASFETVIDEVRDLGNVSAGLNVPMERLALNFGQVRTLGYLAGRELRDFAIAGVPLLDVLSEMTGKTKAQVQDMISERGISYDMVREAFYRMSNEGGRFDGLMAKMSKTTGGLASNIKDLFSLTMREIGSDMNKNIIKDVLKSFYEWGKENNNLRDTLYAVASAVLTIGGAFATWKLGTLAMNIGQLVMSLKALGSAGMLANLKLMLIGVAVAFIVAGLIELYNLLFTDKHTVFHTMLEDLKTIMDYWKTEFVNSSLGKFLGLDGASKAKAKEEGKPEEGVKKKVQNWVNWEIERRGGKKINFNNTDTKLGETAGNMFSDMWTKIKDFALEDMATRRARYNSPVFGDPSLNKPPVVNNKINVYVGDTMADDVRIIESAE